MTGPVSESAPSRDIAHAVEVGPMRRDEAAEVARMHGSFFRGKEHGHSIANLGDRFLERAFYGLNFDNPHFFCDVARVDGRVAGFSVYTTDRHRLFRHTLLHRPAALGFELLHLVLSRPAAVWSLISNGRYVRGEKLPEGDDVGGWWLLLGVQPEYRTREFATAAGASLAEMMATRMETVMREHGCRAWYATPHPWNKAINRFLQAAGGRAAGSDNAQGLDVVFYVRRLDEDPE
jgi:RimJ/RimL family protein N-acetyltransferase